MAKKVTIAKARAIHVKARREIAPFVTKTINAVSWKPQTSWIIVLRTEAGLRDVRSFSGTYEQAVIRRDEYLANSLYASAWLIEERERNNFKPKPTKKEAA